MSSKDEPLVRGIGRMKDWMQRVTRNVTSNGNTEARVPGERRLGPADRRLGPRDEPSDRRRAERRDG